MSKRILVFGTFDLLHAGHLDFLRQARDLGDELHVVVARDQTVMTIKGHASEQNELVRQANLQAQPEVTQAHLGNLGDKYRIIEQIKPDIIALGYDQTSFTKGLPEALKKRGLTPEIIRLQPFHPELYKTSLIRQQAIDKAEKRML